MYKIITKTLGFFLFIILSTNTYPQNNIKFAVIGDFGKAGSNEADVADLVHSWNPDFIITTGDNNYENGELTTIDENIGQYYHDFIFPYIGSYGSGAPDSNLFFPTPGNHDWRATDLLPYLDYFVLNVNGQSLTERYYTVVKGDIEFFILDSDSHEPDGNTYNSTQGLWFQDAISNSTARWKIAVFHHPPYSSDSNHGNNDWMQWDYYGNGVPVVISGHAHTYERINLDNTVYFVNGLGGKSIYSFGNPVPGSQVRYNGDYGAMLVEGNADSLNFKFINVSNEVIDEYVLVYPIPVELTSFRYNLIDNKVELNWTTATESNNRGFSIERKTDERSEIGFVEGNGTTTEYNSYSFVDENPLPGVSQYRLKQIDFDGSFSYSNILEVKFSLPEYFVLDQNYPNPFNPSTTIEYALPEQANVKLVIFDALGKQLDVLYEGINEAGIHKLNWNASGYASGIYFYRLQANNFVQVHKMLLMK